MINLDSASENVSNGSPPAPRPWVRFWARSFDVYTFSIAVGILWGLIDAESLDHVNNTLLSVLLTFSWLFVEGACVAIFGTTLGKWLLKITILNHQGQKLTPAQAFQRSRLVWWRGTGLGIGIPKLIACIIGHSRLVREGITTWDRDMGNTIVHGQISWWRGLIVGIALILTFAISVYGYFL
ncbi:RDD family protein [Paenibacillus elgii]|uniref:RDD family protein n=1 Tax=Paenibacillus elgii TaxID=189691 RepID=UPI0013D40D68|nr:RDD family protein [Paenibacillus elgii]NEN82617.1 RDD family protein [Paenibacillus elgii]